MGENSNRNRITRRKFLRLGVLGATSAAVGFGPANALAAELIKKMETKPGPVYRTLGRTGLKVTVVSFGAMLTPEWEVIRAGFDEGINYVDTARRYMNGKNEEIVGKALKGYRDKVYVATKTKPTSISKADLFADVETSLSKLGTDYVDVIQLHNLDKKDRAFIPETREALLELRKQGKVRFFGVTTHTNQAEVVNALASDPDKFFDTVLTGYNFKSSPELKEAIAKAAKAGMGVIAMKTQAGGYKTDALGPLSPHQAALKWVLQDRNVSCAIPGMQNMDMFREDISVMGMMKLTRADERVLERYGQAIRPYYCHLCAECEGGCPQNVAVSVVNRCLMYADAYGSMELAKATYEELESDNTAAACLDCETCAASCVNGIRDIGARMRRAARLFA